uniref:(northern house mosquito) hypothetical protein n=1 Tax=Culex pipiens TaxID=7175 RepID=A0A8D8A2Y2_CULPI
MTFFKSIYLCSLPSMHFLFQPKLSLAFSRTDLRLFKPTHAHALTTLSRTAPVMSPASTLGGAKFRTAEKAHGTTRSCVRVTTTILPFSVTKIRPASGSRRDRLSSLHSGKAATRASRVQQNRT